MFTTGFQTHVAIITDVPRCWLMPVNCCYMSCLGRCSPLAASAIFDSKSNALLAAVLCSPVLKFSCVLNLWVIAPSPLFTDPQGRSSTAESQVVTDSSSCIGFRLQKCRNAQLLNQPHNGCNVHVMLSAITVGNAVELSHPRVQIKGDTGYVVSHGSSHSHK